MTSAELAATSSSEQATQELHHASDSDQAQLPDLLPGEARIGLHGYSARARSRLQQPGSLDGHHGWSLRRLSRHPVHPTFGRRHTLFGVCGYSRWMCVQDPWNCDFCFCSICTTCLLTTLRSLTVTASRPSDPRLTNKVTGPCSFYDVLPLTAN